MGAYALADGILSLIAAYRVRDQGKPFWSLVMVGLLGIAAGIVTFIWPGMTALLLLIFIAAWAIVMGIFQIIAAIRLRKEIQNEGCWAFPAYCPCLRHHYVRAAWSRGHRGNLAIAAYSIVFGVLLIWLGLRLKKRSESRTVAA